MEKHVIVTLKNGLRFEHHPHVDDEQEWVNFMIEVGTPVGSKKSTTLLVHRPTTVYDMAEVVAIQFGEPEDLPNEKLPLGFLGG